MKYEIKGETLPVVVCQLEEGEQMITEGGGMSWMSANMKMETTSNGGVGKALGRMFAGEKIFQNVYTAQGGAGLIAFASSFPGSIKAFEISPGNELICQKGVFLAGEMQKLSGNGLAFGEFDGHVVEYSLAAGQQIVVDTGHLAAMSATCSMDIQTVPGMKNKFLGGEGLFNTIVSGPGHVWLQTMPLPNVAGVLRPYMPTGN